MSLSTSTSSRLLVDYLFNRLTIAKDFAFLAALFFEPSFIAVISVYTVSILDFCFSFCRALYTSPLVTSSNFT